MMCMKNILRNT